MAHKPVDRGCSGHRIVEDEFPFGKRQIAGEHDTALLIAIGQEGEEHFHFGAILLDIANVIDQHHPILDLGSRQQARVDE